MLSRPEFEKQLLSHTSALKSYALNLCWNADLADDLVQETMLRALRACAQFDGDNMLAWLFTILKFYLFSVYRKNKRLVFDEAVFFEATKNLTAPDDPFIQLYAKQTFKQVDELNPISRDALYLHVVHGLTYKEAGAVCNEALGTMKSRVTRARWKLGIGTGKGC